MQVWRCRPGMACSSKEQSLQPLGGMALWDPHPPSCPSGLELSPSLRCNWGGGAGGLQPGLELQRLTSAFGNPGALASC